MNNSEQFSLTVAGDCLRVDGVLNFTTAARMSPELHRSIAAMPDRFTVELSGLQDFNSAVLVFMLDCARLSMRAGKHCRFAGAKPGLDNMLKMASLEELIHPS